MYYGISLVSVILYDPDGLLNYDFYRYDGNFIISFAPFLAVPFVKTKIDVIKMVKAFVVVSTIVNFPPMVRSGFSHFGDFDGLFIAHNAFGGFLMSTVAVSYVWWRQERSRAGLLLFTMNIVYLLVSGSRGSLLGIGLAIPSLFLIDRLKGAWVGGGILLIVLIEAAILSQTYPIYLEYHGLTESLIAADTDGSKEANVAIRALFDWPRGLECFFASPIFGAGFGAVNDLPLDFKESFSLFQFNRGPHIYDSAHAHNSFIHILGEQGVVGFAIFMMFWVSVFREANGARDQRFMRAIALLGYFSLTFASFTEHRIPAPSNALPVNLMFLLMMAVKNSRFGRVGAKTAVPGDVLLPENRTA